MLKDYVVRDIVEHTTIQGDTFDALALSYYGEEYLATLIMEANPDYCDVLIFDAGVKLYIPIVDDANTPETLPPWRRNT